jgi:hypothetical protein
MFPLILEFLDLGSLRGIETLQAIAQCTSLCSLELNDDLININYATALITLTNLTRLYIPSFAGMSDVLSHLTNLKCLALCLCSTEEMSISSYLRLTTLINLTHLKLDLSLPNASELFSLLFTALTNLYSLGTTNSPLLIHSLKLTQTHSLTHSTRFSLFLLLFSLFTITKSISNLYYWFYLTLTLCSEINFVDLTEPHITVLNMLSKLRYLSLENCRTHSLSSIPFNSLPNLYQLYLPKTGVTKIYISLSSSSYSSISIPFIGVKLM